LESVTENKDAEEKRVVAPPQSSDRAVIGKAESLKLQMWIEQIKESTRGFLNPTKSDLVNFLIREHKEELTSREMTQIRSLNYDPVKHINWISQELKAAYSKPDFEMVALLQSELKQIELSPSAHRSIHDDSVTASTGQKRKRKRANKSADRRDDDAESERTFDAESDDKLKQF